MLAMFRWQNLLLLVLVCIPVSLATARRRPKVKVVPTFSITGTVEATEAPPKTEAEQRVAFLRQLKEKGYHRYRDPLVILPQKLFLSNRLAVVVWDTAAPPPNPIASSQAIEALVTRGGAFIPQLWILNFEADFHVLNRGTRDVKLFSPGRVINGTPVGPETLAPDSDRVIAINPRGAELEDKNVKFWSYPLRLVGSPSAIGRVLFVRSHHFTLVNDDGTFTLPPLPAGKYQVSILDRSRELDTREVVIPEKGKGELKPLEVKVTLPFSTEEF
jgi:hypothetical protein